MRIQIFHDNDADGITSAVIASIVHDEMGDDVIITPLLGPNEKEIIAKTIPADLYYFLDVGSTIMNFIERKYGKKAIVIDHHKGPNREFNVKEYINYSLGGNRIKYATASIETYSYFDEKYGVDDGLAFPAIVGAIGDLANEDGSFHGMTKKTFNILVKSKNFEVKKDFRGMGKSFLPLAITIDTNLFPATKMKYHEIVQVLGENSMALYPNVKSEVISILPKIYGKNICSAISSVIYGNFGGQKMEAHDIALILNNYSGDIVKIVNAFLGKETSFNCEKLEILRRFVEFELFFDENKLEQYGPITYMIIPPSIDVEIGFVANYILKKFDANTSAVFRPFQNKMFVTVHSNTFNIEKPVRIAAIAAGGRGGGHDFAAGAIIQASKKEKFLAELKKEIFKEMKSQNLEQDPYYSKI